jgi:hypothetical protein
MKNGKMMNPNNNDEPSVWTKNELITPEVARTYLEYNHPNNRNIVVYHVEFLTKEILEGYWKPGTGQPINFDIHGQLINGQHRLLAIIKADQAVWCTVAYDCQEDAFLSLDVGRKRTTADVLHVAGEKDANTLSGALRLLQAWEANANFDKHDPVSGPAATDILKVHARLREAIGESRRYFKVIGGLGPSLIVTFWYLISTIERDEADAFYGGLFEGANLTIGHPVLALRNLLLAQNQHSRRWTIPRQTKVYGRYLVKGWNLFALGMRRTQIKVMDTEVLDHLETPIGTHWERYQVTALGPPPRRRGRPLKQNDTALW